MKFSATLVRALTKFAMIAGIFGLANVAQAQVVRVQEQGLFFYYYTSNGLELGDQLGARAVVTGYGTGSRDGQWAIAGGAAEVPVTRVRSFYNAARTCRFDEVPTGVLAQGVLRCRPLRAGLALHGRNWQVGPWGHNIQARCPRDQVMVSWQFPQPNYTVQYECARIVERRGRP